MDRSLIMDIAEAPVLAAASSAYTRGHTRLPDDLSGYTLIESEPPCPLPSSPEYLVPEGFGASTARVKYIL